jgi:predicted phosphoribosyltransferase
MRFKDRVDAGRMLAAALSGYRGESLVVFALPRGGVVLGSEIARSLNAPLDLVIARKIGHPQNEEYAVCAVAEDGDMLCNEAAIAELDQEWLRAQAERERLEARRRREVYLRGSPPRDVEGKTAIVVDDGVATGLTIMLAIHELRHRSPKKIVVAVPVAPKETAEAIQKEVDELVALEIPRFYLGAVGAYYEEFPQVTDGDVIRLMAQSDALPAGNR